MKASILRANGDVRILLTTANIIVINPLVPIDCMKTSHLPGAMANTAKTRKWTKIMSALLGGTATPRKIARETEIPIQTKPPLAKLQRVTTRNLEVGIESAAEIVNGRRQKNGQKTGQTIAIVQAVGFQLMIETAVEKNMTWIDMDPDAIVLRAGETGIMTMTAGTAEVDTTRTTDNPVRRGQRMAYRTNGLEAKTALKVAKRATRRHWTRNVIAKYVICHTLINNS
jgi:hypothetical protein